MSDSPRLTPDPFTLAVCPETHDWITSRVSTARIIPDLAHPADSGQYTHPTSAWSYGTPTAVVQSLVDYWRDKYDWRAVEREINEKYRMFTVPIEEGEGDEKEVIELHFVHHRSEREGAVPMLFAHGWPGNFLEVEPFLKLTEPEDPQAQAFHVVAPSIPGFTLSSAPKNPGFTLSRIARVYHKLMLVLGYPRYVGQGGDWGSFILRSLAIQYPHACLGIHLNFLMGHPPSPLRDPLAFTYLLLRWFTSDEKARLERVQMWVKEDLGYAMIQGTKPQTIGYALMDSPVGMLAWIRDKLEGLVEPEFVWTEDTVLTWVTLYLLSGSAGHARIYKEAIPTLSDEVLQWKIHKQVAVGVSVFPKDTGYVPRWWAEATVAEDIVFWREHEKGGHFASIECPEVLLDDFQDFVGKIGGERSAKLIQAGKLLST